MSQEQVSHDYEKLLKDREERMRADLPKTRLGRFLFRLGLYGQHHYPMPLKPLDNDYRKQQ